MILSAILDHTNKYFYKGACLRESASAKAGKCRKFQGFRALKSTNGGVKNAGFLTQKCPIPANGLIRDSFDLSVQRKRVAIGEPGNKINDAAKHVVLAFALYDCPLRFNGQQQRQVLVLA